MDVISPELFWIGKSCYRLPDVVQEQLIGQIQQDADVSFEDQVCEDDEDDYEDIEEIAAGKLVLRYSVSKAFFGSIIGAQGSVRRRIEEETRTTVSVPRQNHDGDIVVTGGCRRDVILAKKHLEATVLAARNKRSFTHFLSLPLTSDEIKSNFLRFKAKVLELCPYLQDDIFPAPETLHLTLEMLVLTDNQERSDACQRLKELSALLTPLLVGRELRVEARGIEYFTDDPSMVHVLYAKATNPILQELAETVSRFFQRTGFTKKVSDDSSVKLHMTIMNTRFLEKTNQKREPFDARPILQSFKDFYFGTITLKTLHLSRLGTRGDDGYYLPSAIIHLQSPGSLSNC